jgi:hypothetical protein
MSTEARRVQRGVSDFNVTQAKKELYDYWVLMQNMPKILDAVTGGRISKPMTCPLEVISVFEDYTGDLVMEQVKEQTEEITREKDQALQDLESLKRNLTSAERIRSQNVLLRRAARMALQLCSFPGGAMKVKKALEDALHIKVQSEETPQEENSDERGTDAGDNQGSP